MKSIENLDYRPKTLAGRTAIIAILSLASCKASPVAVASQTPPASGKNSIAEVHPAPYNPNLISEAEGLDGKPFIITIPKNDNIELALQEFELFCARKGYEFVVEDRDELGYRREIFTDFDLCRPKEAYSATLSYTDKELIAEEAPPRSEQVEFRIIGPESDEVRVSLNEVLSAIMQQPWLLKALQEQGDIEVTGSGAMAWLPENEIPKGLKPGDPIPGHQYWIIENSRYKLDCETGEDEFIDKPYPRLNGDNGSRLFITFDGKTIRLKHIAQY